MPRRYTPLVPPKRVTRAVYGVFVVLIAAFVVSSITQVARVVFGGPEAEAAAADARYPTVGPECGRQLEQQAAAIERARLAASTEPSADTARLRYANERRISREQQPPELERACSGDPHGTDALAALASLDRAAEAHAVRDATELSPVRLAAHSFISGHPR